MLQNKWGHSIENKNIESGRALEAAFKNEIIVKYLALQKDKQSTQQKKKYMNQNTLISISHCPINAKYHTQNS